MHASQHGHCIAGQQRCTHLLISQACSIGRMEAFASRVAAICRMCACRVDHPAEPTCIAASALGAG